MAAEPQVVPMFATPIVLFEVPDAVALNLERRRVIEEREKSHPSTHKSKIGGWQSDIEMERWGGVPALKLIAYGRNVANRMTTDRQGNVGGGPHPGFFAVTWRGNMWANINRAGNANEVHSHPGAFWSGVYYVDDGGIADDPSLGGGLEFFDPRGPGPAMGAPHLGFAVPGGLTAGLSEKLSPRAGRLVMLPSWIMHQVRVYRGTRERISIAFNLTV